METAPKIQQDSNSWLVFVKLCFGLSVLATSSGIFFLPVDIWIKGYMAMGLLFTIGSTITMSKTLRDQHESQKLLRQLSMAHTEKVLKEYELQP